MTNRTPGELADALGRLRDHLRNEGYRDNTMRMLNESATALRETVGAWMSEREDWHDGLPYAAVSVSEPKGRAVEWMAPLWDAVWYAARSVGGDPEKHTVGVNGLSRETAVNRVTDAVHVAMKLALETAGRVEGEGAREATPESVMQIIARQREDEDLWWVPKTAGETFYRDRLKEIHDAALTSPATERGEPTTWEFDDGSRWELGDSMAGGSHEDSENINGQMVPGFITLRIVSAGGDEQQHTYNLAPTTEAPAVTEERKTKNET